MIGIAQTGTGKTASFVLPMIDILAEGRSRARMPRSLILEPTRELAAQVAENFEKYGKYHKLSMALLIGGVQMGDQVKALEKGVDVLIATPGRLMDLFGRGKIMLNDCNLLVIDEADRMLDMGFIPDIEEICTKLPKQRQTLLFSATMPPPIKKLADKFLSDPKTIEVARPATANINIEQRLIITRGDKKRDVLRTILRGEDFKNAIVFCNKKTTVRELYTSLKRSGFAVGQIQGDMDQSNRIAEFDRFKNDEINILVASDVAARGLDVKGVSHVINFDVPWQPDDYIHRIGRTGRAGAKGIAITLATREDAEPIAAIEKLTGLKLPRVDGEQTAAEPVEEARREEEPSRGRGRSRGRGKSQAPREAQPRAPREEAPAPREAQPQARREEAPAPRPPEPIEQRPAKQSARARPADRDEADDWNGPVPSFPPVQRTLNTVIARRAAPRQSRLDCFATLAMTNWTDTAPGTPWHVPPAAPRRSRRAGPASAAGRS